MATSRFNEDKSFLFSIVDRPLTHAAPSGIDTYMPQIWAHKSAKKQETYEGIIDRVQNTIKPNLVNVELEQWCSKIAGGGLEQVCLPIRRCIAQHHEAIWFWSSELWIGHRSVWGSCSEDRD